MRQRSQLDRLRVKYANAILTSHMNVKENFIVKESKILYKKIVRQGLLKVVIQASLNTQKKKDIIEIVLILDDSTTKE